MPGHVVVRWLAALAALPAALFAVPAAAVCTLGEAGRTVHAAVPDSGRAVLLHMPAGADGKRLPLILLFHGSGSNAAEILKNSGLEATADRQGFMLAAADAGIRANGGFAWNIPGVPTRTRPTRSRAAVRPIGSIRCPPRSLAGPRSTAVTASPSPPP